MKYYYPKKQALCILKVVSLLVLTLNSGVFAQAKPEEKPRIDIQNSFTASGYIGDGEFGRKYIVLNGAFNTNPHSQPSCIKVKYTFGPKRWGGVYWQNKPDNWGDKSGNDYSKDGFKKVTFWAKGTTGNEVVEFKAGGISNSAKKYQDSFDESIGRVPLSKEWKQYTLDIGQADLASVIGGFCWVASADYNDQLSITFYLDDVYFQ